MPYFVQEECVERLPVNEQPSDLQRRRDLECICWTVFLCSVTVQAETSVPSYMKLQLLA